MASADPDLGEDAALALDARADPASRRGDFLIPPAAGGDFPLSAYLVGNSLGLQPRTARDAIAAVLDDWATRGVRGHAAGEHPWGSFDAALRGPAARIVGAREDEIVTMNSLTVNLHLLLATFYRPTPVRHRILIEDSAFPSDSYAVRSHVAWHGHDPDTAILRVAPRDGADVLRTEDLLRVMEEHAHSIATVLLGGVNYLTGEVLDIPAVTAAAHDIGANAGWDLAHAAGNVPLALHDWDVDFAAWCTYKYLNAGPGAVAGAFVHERHLGDTHLPRLEGWWSTDSATRFAMRPVSEPPATASAWAISNLPIVSMAPLRSSLEIVDQVGMAALRDRSLRLTAYLRAQLDPLESARMLAIVTPADPDRHGAQLSVRVGPDPTTVCERLSTRWGVEADDRRPDIVRLAPAPLYTTFHDCWRAADALAHELDGSTVG